MQTPSINQSSLSKNDGKLLLLVMLVNALSYFDFLIFLFMLEPLSHVFFPKTQVIWVSLLQVIGIFSLGYLARPIGAIFIGQYGDTKGRKPALTLSLWFVAIATMLLAVLPSFQQVGWLAPFLLVMIRLLQGIGFGGLIASSWVFLVEHLDRRHFTFACSCLFTAYLFGLLTGLLFFMGFDDAIPQAMLTQHGWRIPFVFGGIISFFLLFLCYQTDETPMFEYLKTHGKIQPHSFFSLYAVKTLFSKHLGNLFTALILSWFASSIILVIALLLPELIFIAFDLDDDYIRIASALGILFMIFGCFFYGFLAEKIRVGKVLVVGSILLMSQILLFYYQLKNGDGFILVFYALLGFTSGIIGLIPSILLRLFPANLRVTGVSITYNFMSAVIGGILPFIIILFTEHIGMMPALYVTFMCFVASIMGSYLYRTPPMRHIDDVD